MVVTPHLGASTEEAQDKAGMTIAEQVELALAGDFVPYAVNVAATEVSETVRPFMALAEQLGRILASLHDGLPDRLDIEYQGDLAAAGHRHPHPLGPEGPLRHDHRGAGLLRERPAAGRSSAVSRSGRPPPPPHTTTSSLVTLRSSAPRGGGHPHRGRARAEPRLVMVDDHTVEVPPSPHMLVVRNDDRPGMIGVVGMVLGDAGISISSMAVGPAARPRPAPPSWCWP